MTINQVTQTDPGARARVIKLGLDVHASLIVVVRQVDEQASQPPQRFSEEAFIGFISRQLAQADSVHSCYEAGPFGYVLHRRLVRLGVHNIVVRPRDWSTYGERVKTDSRDAGALCSCLDRYLSGNLGALAVVWIPSEGRSRPAASAASARAWCASASGSPSRQGIGPAARVIPSGGVVAGAGLSQAGVAR